MAGVAGRADVAPGLVDDHRDEGGLAGAVAADQADLLAGADDERGVAEQGAVADFDGEGGADDHGGGVTVADRSGVRSVRRVLPAWSTAPSLPQRRTRPVGGRPADARSVVPAPCRCDGGRSSAGDQDVAAGRRGGVVHGLEPPGRGGGPAAGRWCGPGPCAGPRRGRPACGRARRAGVDLRQRRRPGPGRGGPADPTGKPVRYQPACLRNWRTPRSSPNRSRTAARRGRAS